MIGDVCFSCVCKGCVDFYASNFFLSYVAAVPAVWWGTDNVLLYESLYDSTRLRADVHEAKLILVGDAAAAVGGESTSSK